MDILYRLAGAECTSISSFGGLKHFRCENAPANVPKRCLDGCDLASECPYDAPRTYLNEPNESFKYFKITMTDDPSVEGRLKAMIEGLYGRCVYYCDNNVVDSMEFENKVPATFTMCAFTNTSSVTLKLMGTEGEIKASLEKSENEISDFLTENINNIRVKRAESGHNGGDEGIIKDFLNKLGRMIEVAV